MFTYLPEILDKERGQIRLTEYRWRPTNLLFISQARLILRDIDRRYRLLVEARSEMSVLDRADLYIKTLSGMRLNVRQAHFNWKGDQLVFMRAVANFYSGYAKVLRLIQQDTARGILKNK